MSRYIDADALIARIREVYCTGCNSYNEVRCRACGTGDAILQIDSEPAADVAPVDELIEAAKQIVCENTYPSFDHNGKPVNVWKAREGYDALDALKEKYKGE
ncbi:MAG: hypothetical protein IKI93_18305 [Clostridia bacterium]|nr:hypothetical protein [Clostridia bacterium]